ncbi:hypothetical protein C7974DRAFT_401844 [Boeremia exigua]|uniref:uncharacterized protein n=1 Tax=Boeremia exigua TaxID=749465 RepID=UPI001E8CE3A2|nr:uncharacterized protein C7974DRAFT_401844 [Boeremia exigua]KAH6616476.1 hypothetical protein C7974DRAFT_401844 [Boeremia exigua]
MTRRPVDAPRSLLYHGYSSQQIHKNGSGKVGPEMYGGGLSWDLGLCFAHFLTYERCEHGQACEWRHRELTAEERDYIFKQGHVQFLLKADMFVDDKTS